MTLALARLPSAELAKLERDGDGRDDCSIAVRSHCDCSGSKADRTSSCAEALDPLQLRRQPERPSVGLSRLPEQTVDGLLRARKTLYDQY